jgi:hypothetical protein
LPQYALVETKAGVLLSNGIEPAAPAPPRRLVSLIEQDIIKLRSLIAQGRKKVD